MSIFNLNEAETLNLSDPMQTVLRLIGWGRSKMTL